MDHIDFNAAGENLAYGQVSSIYAHEGLMNSLGHRKNILNTHYKNLGLGVDFNEDKQPFWTERLYRINVYLKDIGVFVCCKDVDIYDN